MIVHAMYFSLLVSKGVSVLTCGLNTIGNMSEWLLIEELPPVIEPRNASEILNKLLKNYDKRLRPGHAERPVDIGINIAVLTISDIEEENMKFTVDMYMRQLWFDRRLAFGNGRTALVLQYEVLNKLWLPDTYFENSVKTSGQKETMAVLLYGNGSIFYTQRVTVIARTLMNFQAFPMDKQTFSLTASSYGRGNSQLRYRKIQVNMLNKAQEMADFVIMNQSATITSQKYISGCFDMVKISFIAKRRVGYYFIKVYFPGTLCTVVSWLAFWMDPENIGDRGTVGITSLLTQMFLVQSVNEHMPHVNYVKATDLFLIVSFVFSFITLLESITVYRAAKGGKMEMNASPQNEREDKTEVNQNSEASVTVADRKNSISMILDPTRAKGTSEIKEKKKKNADDFIDRISRVLFPTAYVAFLVCYFTTYMA
ncbi:Gamma-aminobutyric acid receptor subunit alpha-4 [Porites harrisoni]